MKIFEKTIFVNEDISKSENRINLAIFHLQMFDTFHEWFLNKLNLPIDSIIFPAKNDEGTRPDFVIYNNLGEKIGVIEVECGIDLEQFNRFKKIYELKGVKVFSIFGKNEYPCDLSLEEIKDFINNTIDSITNDQLKLSCLYLTNLIDNTIYSNGHTSRQPVSEEFINSNSFLKFLKDKLKDITRIENNNKPIPGFVYYDSNKENGFSLKVYSGKGTGKHIALLSISAGRPLISFQSGIKYRKYLQHKPKHIVDEWIEFISSKLKYPIESLGENQKLNVPIQIVQDNVDELVEIIRKLA